MLRFLAVFATIAAFSPAMAAFADGSAEGVLDPVPAGADPLIAGALTAADRYWARIGYQPRCPAETYLYDDVNPDARAAAETGGCRIWITRTLHTFTTVTIAGYPRADRRLFLRAFCGTIVHERGHNLGLTHDDPGIMRPNRDPLSVPRECWQWARSEAPAKQPSPNLAFAAGRLHR